MRDASVLEWIRQKHECLSSRLNERIRRRWAAAEARSLGWGGATAVAAATGLTRKTIHKGLGELDGEEVDPGSVLPPERSRRTGGGCKPIQQSQLGSLAALEFLVESTACGDPRSSPRWTCKSRQPNKRRRGPNPIHRTAQLRRWCRRSERRWIAERRRHRLGFPCRRPGRPELNN